MSTQNTLADNLDSHPDGWIRSLPCCRPHDTESSFSERLFEVVLLLLDVRIWLLGQWIVEWHCCG